MHKKTKKYIKIILLAPLFLVSILVLLSILLVNSSFINTRISKELSSYLSKELKTEVYLEGFSLGVSPAIELKNLRVIDLNKDTLLAFSTLSTSLVYSDLFSKNIHLNGVCLSDAKSEIGYNKNHKLNLQFIIDRFSKTSTDTSKGDWTFSISNIELDLHNIDFTYYSIPDSINIQTYLDNSLVVMGASNMNSLLMECKQLNINSIFVKMNLFGDKYIIDVENINGDSAWINPLQFEYIAKHLSSKIKLIDINFKDIQNQDFKNIQFAVHNAKAFDGDYSGFIDKLTADSYNQINNIDIKGAARFTYSDMFANNLSFSTKESFAKISGNITYQNLTNLSNLNFVDYSLVKLESRINTKELANFTNNSYLENFNTHFSLKGIISGNNQQWSIYNMNYKDDKNNSLLLNGFINKINYKDSLEFNLLAESNISSQVIDSLSSIKMKPQSIFFKSTLKGEISNINIRAIARTEDGKLILKSNINYPQVKLELTSKDFAVNTQINKDIYIGKLSTKIELKNSNFEINENYLSEGIVDVDYIEINNHQFRNINSNWNIKNKKGNFLVQIEDSLLNIKLKSQINYTNNSWSIHTNSNINKFATSLINDSISVTNISTQFNLDYTKTSDSQNINLLLNNTNLSLLETQINYPKIELRYKEDKESINANLWSRPVDIELNSNLPSDSLELYFKLLSERYINLKSKQLQKDTNINQNFNLKIDLKENDPVINYYSTNLLNFDKASLDIQSSIKTGINAKLDLPFYKISEFQAEDIKLTLADIDQYLNYNIQIGSAQWDSIPLYKINAQGVISDSLILVNIDNTENNQLNNKIGFNIIKDSDNFWNFKINNNWILLNRKWDIQGQGIRTNFKRIKLADISFKKDHSVFSISSDSSNFKLIAQNIIIDKQLAHYLHSPFTGRLNFDVEGEKRNILDSKFKGELSIDSLQQDSLFFGDLKGVITKKKNNNILNLEASLVYQQSQTDIKGKYNFKESQYITDIKLIKFPLALVDPFVDQLTNLTGNINGEILSNYSHNEHLLNANIQLEENRFRYKALQSNFNIKSGNITSKNNILNLDLEILDVKNNSANIIGDIQLTEQSKLNLRLNSKKFIIMDSNKKDNENFNGKLIISTNSKITGSVYKPHIQSYISLEEGTKINILNTDNSLENYQANSDVVILINKQDSVAPLTEKIDSTNFIKATAQANININQETELHIIFDPINQDYLSTKGGGNLSYELLDNGSEALTGTYQIHSGTYKITFQELISKTFGIGENSSIIWVGEKENPELRLNTFYDFKTSPYSLMANQGSMSEREKEMYSGMYDFRLKMNIKGSLEKPELSFKIEDNGNSNSNTLTGISNELDRINNDPSALNQNVFSILLFNKFVSSSESMASNTDLIVNSLGQLVTNELNKLTSEYITFVDIDVGFNTQSSQNAEGSSSYNTSIDLKIEKSFYDNRIRVKVGGAWDMQQDQTSNSTKTYKNDFSIEYMVTKDGRYVAKIYNKDDKDYDGTDVTKNGVSISYSKNFDRFIYLFKKKDTN